MTTRSAYCVPCDMLVEVTLDGDTEQLAAGDVLCPAQGEACRPGSCLLARLSPTQVAKQLDFLPPSGRPGSGRGFREASRLVELARRRSLAREAGRLRRWWRRDGPGGRPPPGG